jgi:hypothetical protein
MTSEAPAIARDYFFEFAGMPKSGKSTVADVVVHFFKRTGTPVTEFHGGGRYVPIDKKARGSLNLVIACRTAEYLVTQSEREVVTPRIYLLDRGPFDCCVFTTALVESGTISREEAASVESLLTVPRIAGRIDGVFAFITTPALSLSREASHKLSVGAGRVMNESTLARLRNTTRNAVETATAFQPATLIDPGAADGDIAECARFVIERMKARMNERDA